MTAPRPTCRDRILQVQQDIAKRLDDDLSLERLAESAGDSPFHFHRLFRGIVGESAAEYVRRLKLERAAKALRSGPGTILQAALAAGYGSHEALTRAFARQYGVTPRDYQAMDHPPQPLCEFTMPAAPKTLADVECKQLPARRIASVRVVGPYNGATLGPAFGRICEWAGRNGAMAPESHVIGVYYDDPDSTPPDQQRADAAVSVGEHVQPEGDIQIQTIPGGLHAVLRHKGPYDTLIESWRWLYGVWLPESGREPGAAPPYELYVNDPSGLPPEEWLTDICIPLAK